MAISFKSENPYMSLGLVTLTLCMIIYKYISSASASKDLPPGPPAHWFFGNTMPKFYAHRKFEEWTQEYGPVFSLKQGSTVLIVIGRHKAAIDIMEKENGSLVDRPCSISASETLSGGMRLLLVRAGNRFRKLRRAIHTHLSLKESQKYEPLQAKNAAQLVLDTLQSPKQHQLHAKRYAGALILSLTYGKRTPTLATSPLIVQVNQCVTRLGETLRPGAYRVDMDGWRWLKFVPGYLSTLNGWHQEELSLFKGQLEKVRKEMATGEAPESFAKYLLERQSELELQEDELAYLAGSMFGAGADTTAAAISTTVLAAALYPEAQAKVQEEMNLVLGKDRAPTFADSSSLPQTHAFVLETFRWRPVSVGGVLHRATKDIVWKNYRIPEGASVRGNHWSIGRDPDVFPEPEHFDPQRWIDGEGKLRKDLKSYPFGFGRRICPGQYVANRSVYITTALLLWAFRISSIPSSPIDPLAFTDTMNTHPLPFEVTWELRNEMDEGDVKMALEGYGGGIAE